jgi:hypothetical protein
MNDETRKKWESIADECFDRAYEKAESQITSKAATEVVPPKADRGNFESN